MQGGLIALDGLPYGLRDCRVVPGGMENTLQPYQDDEIYSRPDQIRRDTALGHLTPYVQPHFLYFDGLQRLAIIKQQSAFCREPASAHAYVREVRYLITRDPPCMIL